MGRGQQGNRRDERPVVPASGTTLGRGRVYSATAIGSQSRPPLLGCDPAAPGLHSIERNCVDQKSALPATLDWNDIDDRAVDTARALAMDAVQKVGNGHPGTAMSLAPAAYLLFQKVMRHNPADPTGSAATASCCRAATQPITLYTQLYLGGFGPRARRPQGAAHLGQQDARSPRATATPPAWRPPPARSARASATPSAWPWRPAASDGLLDPDAAEGESPFDHHVYAHRLRR